VKALTSEEIERSPDKFNIKNLVTSMSPDVKVSEDGELMFRGARKGDMVYMMDGMKSNEVSTVPSCAIGRVMVYTGGLPAKYGDTLGGVVVMETKGYFDLYRQWEATEIKTGKK
jgi:outer membrane receptor for ferrienterochelin and colicin